MNSQRLKLLPDAHRLNPERIRRFEQRIRRFERLWHGALRVSEDSTITPIVAAHQD